MGREKAIKSDCDVHILTEFYQIFGALPVKKLQKKICFLAMSNLSESYTTICQHVPILLKIEQ
jgi:hypothetical protein